MNTSSKCIEHDPPYVRRPGRPRRGTERMRTDALMTAATRVFLKNGYGSASIDKVAHEAGVSTRTIYERFKNKEDLLISVISRLIERDMASVFAISELDQMDLRQALTTIGLSITARARDPQAAALFRIVATEAKRFPALAKQMHIGERGRVLSTVAQYFRGQITRGRLTLAEPERAAALFTYMLTAEIQDCMLLGGFENVAELNFQSHIDLVVDIFLHGTAPHGTD